MASVKGIIVEIGGDTSGLQKALSKVNSSTSSLSKELKGINSLLKLDPKNTELVSQKQKVLKENIEQTSSKLEQLKKAQELADDAIRSGAEISEENQRNLQREIVNTENKLKQLKLEASNWTNAGRSIEEFGNKVKNISEKVDKMGTTLTKRITLPVAAIATASVKTGNEFEAQMSRVKAITGTTNQELEKLTDQAIELGAKTSFSASEVAAGMEELASAGFTANEIISAMPGLLDLAASSGAELATSSEITASAIRGFELEASSASHVADVYAEAAARTNAQTEDMGEAMKYVAPVAKTVGLTIEETAAAIGIMSDAGVKGSQAGTSLRAGLSRIIKPTKQVQEAMETLGVEFYDNNGKMKSLSEIVQTLQEKTKDLTDETKNQALAQIFGTDALSGMLALINRGSDELSDMTKSFEKCDGAAAEMAETMLDNTAGAAESLSGSLESAGIVIQKALSPNIKKLAKWIQGLVDDFTELSDEEQQNIINNALLVASIGPAIKILGTLGTGMGNAAKDIGTLSQAIGVMKTGMESTNTSANTLAKGIEAIISPTGLVVAAITIATIGIVTAVKNAEKDTKEAFTNMGNGATGFVKGIETATSHLDSFNSTLFASSEEQQKLQEDMDNIQKGITEICKRASAERRDYTQEEITQLDEYFNKLRELKNRELEIQQSISNSISQQAEQNAQSFQGNLEEYKINAQEWIKTAEEQAQKEINIINDRTTQEIALLQQRYGEKANLENEEYAREYNGIISQKDKAIQEANDQVARVNLAYANGYLERNKQNDGFFAILQEYNAKIEQENINHNNELQRIEDNGLLTLDNKMAVKESQNQMHEKNMKKIWKDMYKNMSQEQEEELGTWLAMVAQTEMYGGEIDDETRSLVDAILESYDKMPKKTKETMKNAMQPMLEEMEKKEPSLFSKAKGIADGILSRLNKAFDIHSPSRKTRKIFNRLMQGGELGIEDEETNIYRQVDSLSKGILNGFDKINIEKKLNIPKIKDFGNLQGALSTQIVDSTKTIFTTPQIVFNVRELDEARLQQCFNYINKKFGSVY